LNLTKATGKAGIPIPSTSSTSAKADGAPVMDRNWSRPIHAAAAILCFAITMPFGAICRRAFKTIKIHAAVQIIAVIGVIVTLGTGIRMSPWYNKVS